MFALDVTGDDAVKPLVTSTSLKEMRIDLGSSSKILKPLSLWWC